MKRIVLAALAYLALAACASTVGPVTTLPTPQSPDQVLFEAQVTLDGLVKQADIYARLPRCGTAGATALCSTTTLAQQASRAAYDAQAAITAARPITLAYGAITSPTATDTQKAQAALSAVTTALTAASDLVAALPKS